MRTRSVLRWIKLGSVDLDRVRKSLEASGGHAELIETGKSRALVLQDSRDGESRWIVDGDVADLLEPGARVLGTEQMEVGGVTVPVTRVSAPALRAHDEKIGEPPGNLDERNAWFRKRH
jgi:hypothetical protein